MFITKEEILKKFPDILEFFEHPKRKYQVQEEYDLSRGEAELITDVLLRENAIKNSSLGWVRTEGN